jgi:hypothetical protein
VVTLTFLLARVISPDPTNLFVQPQSDAATRAAVRHSLGLDQPREHQPGCHGFRDVSLDLRRDGHQRQDRADGSDLGRRPVGVRPAWLLVRLARLGDVVEADGLLGLPVDLGRSAA